MSILAYLKKTEISSTLSYSSAPSDLIGQVTWVWVRSKRVTPSCPVNILERGMKQTRIFESSLVALVCVLPNSNETMLSGVLKGKGQHLLSRVQGKPPVHLSSWDFHVPANATALTSRLAFRRRHLIHYQREISHPSEWKWHPPLPPSPWPVSALQWWTRKRERPRRKLGMKNMKECKIETLKDRKKERRKEGKKEGKRKKTDDI